MAVLLVVACHSFPGYLTGAGASGVTVFFVLSGFLISSLLMDERARTGRVDFKGFYWRRALRLAPAALVFLVVIAMVQPLLGFAPFTAGQLGALVLYVGNWVPASGGSLGLAGHMWSLAVEEQFYLVFPVVFVALLRFTSRRSLLALLLAGVVASDAVRLASSTERAYYGTDTNLAALLLGVTLAVVMHRARIGWTVPAWVAVSPLLLLVPACVFPSIDASMASVPVLAGPVAAVTVFLLMHAEAPKWLTARWLVLVGKRSYGLYLWHYPVMALAVPLLPSPWMRPAAIALAWGLTCLSWRFVEQPFLRLKDRPTGTRRHGGSIPAPTVLAATPVALTR